MCACVLTFACGRGFAQVGRAGAAAMSVRQDVEYVPDDEKIVHLLKTLQKVRMAISILLCLCLSLLFRCVIAHFLISFCQTAPPVLIFAENQKDVDDIHEYLLLRNVEAVAIHGGKLQGQWAEFKAHCAVVLLFVVLTGQCTEERREAVQLFKAGKKDVLVATDVGAKGLDFPGVQHVINFDMPREIENYVHRIGRTGRGGAKGVATTFLGPNCHELILLDLR